VTQLDQFSDQVVDAICKGLGRTREEFDATLAFMTDHDRMAALREYRMVVLRESYDQMLAFVADPDRLAELREDYRAELSGRRSRTKPEKAVAP